MIKQTAALFTSDQRSSGGDCCTALPVNGSRASCAAPTRDATPRTARDGPETPCRAGRSGTPVQCAECNLHVIGLWVSDRHGLCYNLWISRCRVNTLATVIAGTDFKRNWERSNCAVRDFAAGKMETCRAEKACRNAARSPSCVLSFLPRAVLCFVSILDGSVAAQAKAR